MTLTTPNEREDWAKTFLEAGTKEIGMDLSVLVGVVSEIVSRTRQEEREKFVKIIEDLGSNYLCGACQEGISNLSHTSLCNFKNKLLEQARNLT